MKQKRIKIKYSGSINEERKLMGDIWNQLVGTGRQVKCVIGMGGIGKTFRLLKYNFEKRLCKDHQVPFIYVCDNTISRDLLVAGNGVNMVHRLIRFGENEELAEKLGQLKYIQPGLYYEDKIICYVIPFVEYMKYKMLALEGDCMILDEFIPEKINWQNKNMVECIQSLSETIERDSSVDVYLCANPRRLDNPFMDALEIKELKPDHIGLNAVCAAAWITSDTMPALHKHKMENTFAGMLSTKTNLTHRVSGKENLNSSIGTVDGEALYNICGAGFKAGVYKCKSNPTCLCVWREDPKAPTFAEKKENIIKGCILQKTPVEHCRTKYGLGNMRFVNMQWEDTFKVILGIKE